jgi:15-hydroxyprostaglandin dehydrogenase (NAD)
MDNRGPEILLGGVVGGRDVRAIEEDEQGGAVLPIACLEAALLAARRDEDAVRKMRLVGTDVVIVNTASLIGLGPMASAPVYAATKAGVVNFSRSPAYLAEESNIRVDTICPELVDTPLASALGEEILSELRTTGRILKAEEIAAGVIELIEDDTRCGAVMKITVQGGREIATI